MDLKGLWKFILKNDGSKDAGRVTLELPFDGVYQIVNTDQSPQKNLSVFKRSIQLDSIAPFKEVTLLIWSNVDANPGLENDIRLNSSDGDIAIDYPVRTTGFLAWVERHKSVISLVGLLLFLFLVLS